MPRAEFAEAAAREEFPATFVVDLDRVETGAGDGVVHARVAVDWDKETLDQLLATTDDEELALWFDERELAGAFDDVDAHGLRERAAVLAIAVTAAGVGATPALAQAGSHGSAVPMGIERGMQLDQQVSAGPAHSPDAETPTLTSSGGSRGSAVPMGVERGLQSDRQIPGGRTHSPSAEPPAVTSTGGSGLSAGELAAIAGGSAILIAAAGFGIARKHEPPVQPV